MGDGVSVDVHKTALYHDKIVKQMKRRLAMHVKNFCLMILLLFALLLTSSRVHAADNRLFPVNGGETYVYTVKNSLGETWQMKTYVSGAVAMPIISTAYNIFDVLEGTSSKFKVLRSTTTAVYNYDGFGKEYVEWKNAPVNTTRECFC